MPTAVTLLTVWFWLTCHRVHSSCGSHTCVTSMPLPGFSTVGAGTAVEYQTMTLPFEDAHVCNRWYPPLTRRCPSMCWATMRTCVPGASGRVTTARRRRRRGDRRRCPWPGEVLRRARARRRTAATVVIAEPQVVEGPLSAAGKAEAVAEEADAIEEQGGHGTSCWLVGRGQRPRGDHMPPNGP